MRNTIYESNFVMEAFNNGNVLNICFFILQIIVGHRLNS